MSDDRVRAWLDERKAIHAATDTGRWYAFDTGIGSSAIPSDEAVLEDAYIAKADKSAIVDAHNHLPKALAGIEAVLEVHKPVSEFGFLTYCAECVEFDEPDNPDMDAATQVVYPCPTRRALTGVIDGG